MTARPPEPASTTGTVITVAPTGTHQRVEVPHLPVTPEELASTATDCERIGASMIDLEPRRESALRDVVAAIRQHSGLVVRVAAHPRSETLGELLDAGADAIACPLGEGREFVTDVRERAHEREVAVHYEARELAQLVTFGELCREDDQPVHAVLVLGAGGMPGDVVALVQALSLLPPGATFTASGVEKASLPVMLTALAAGGHVRVGLADTLSYADGVPARDNAQLVARAAGLAKIAQRPPTSVSETRELLFGRTDH